MGVLEDEYDATMIRLRNVENRREIIRARIAKDLSELDTCDGEIEDMHRALALLEEKMRHQS